MDGWLARINSTGQFDWAMKFGGFDIDVGWDVVPTITIICMLLVFTRIYTEFNATH